MQNCFQVPIYLKCLFRSETKRCTISIYFVTDTSFPDKNRLKVINIKTRILIIIPIERMNVLKTAKNYSQRKKKTVFPNSKN